MRQPTLLIVGADGLVGQETARLAVAYGARVLATVAEGDRPEIDEPWVEGVEWMTDAEGRDRAADAVLVLTPKRWREPTARPFDRLVMVNPSVEPSVADADEVVVATHGEVHTDPIESLGEVEPSSGIRLERLAMALLRAALDVEIPPRLDNDDLVELGDAVFLQRGS